MRFSVIILFAVLVLSSFALNAFSESSISCPYPVNIKLDGNLSDWEGISFIHVPHTQGKNPGKSEQDISFDFAVAADDDWLYVAVVVKDDKLIMAETEDYYDDAVELYIDANDDHSKTYQNDDSQIIIPLVNSVIKNVEKPLLSGGYDGALTGIKAMVITTSDGYLVEAAIPLRNNKWETKPGDGKTIGFNIQADDDDDYGNRDHKLNWSLLDMEDEAWKDPSVFGELKFIKKSGE